MSKHKYTNFVCLSVITVAVILTVIILIIKTGQGDQQKGTSMQYETKLFNTDVVHTIDIIIDQSDWDSIQENASAKEYMQCDIVIDGETFQNVAIRAKGNSSLSSVTFQDSERYSFKIEFDHYTDGNTAWGLDKLSLNNIIQDPTYMKDYISYSLMREMGADAPLCSYIDVKLNGENFGLYLAVEGIEESFVQRNYGTDYGNLYKPETQNGFGNINFDKEDMSQIINDQAGMPDFSQMFENGYGIPDFTYLYGYGGNGMPDFPQFSPEGEVPDPENGGQESTDESNVSQGNRNQGNINQGNVNQGNSNQGNANQGNENPGNANQGNINQRRGQLFGGMGGSNSGSDVALKYIDDEISSYSNIFDEAVLEATNQDKKRLIASIKQLNSGENLDEVLNVEEVLKFFVVHNFVNNYDSYTGNMLHNYYLYEKDGKLSMIAWDYNLAFGGFDMGQNMGGQADSSEDQSTTYVNYPIDTPVSGTTMEERPLLNELLTNEEYLEQYHDLFDQFISNYFENGYYEQLIEKTRQLIKPYVEKDKTAFFTVDEFEKGVTALKQFCNLRAESIRGQLEGTIPSTSDGQNASDTFIDASSINMDDLGSAFGGGGFGNAPNANGTISNLPFGQNENGTDIGMNNYGNVFNMAGFGDRANMADSNQVDKNTVSNLVITLVSVLVLIIGLIWVRLYQRKRYKNKST